VIALVTSGNTYYYRAESSSRGDLKDLTPAKLAHANHLLWTRGLDSWFHDITYSGRHSGSSGLGAKKYMLHALTRAINHSGCRGTDSKIAQSNVMVSVLIGQVSQRLR
jgi:hypothetical protein